MHSCDRFKRIYEYPTSSVLLLGPRGIGKSSFIKQDVQPDLVIDLLKAVTARQLMLNPTDLEVMVGHLKPGQMILIDEIQKIPELLSEVHRLIEDRGLRFILTGSSARKLKKAGTNLLGGRALSRKMFPLTLKEIGGARSVNSLLMRGLLPYAVSQDSEEVVNDYLFSYTETYLKEEVFQESLTRSLTDFSRFIEIAGRYQGQILNGENIARETGKSGDTIKSWFQILYDTLVAVAIEPYPLMIATRETKHSKFYFFDCGVARAAAGVRDLGDVAELRGYYFETIILNELRAYAEVNKKPLGFYYYQIPGSGEVDFIVETKRKSLSRPAEFYGLEIKLTKKWSPQFEKMAKRISEAQPRGLNKMIGVYLGDQRLTHKHMDIYPVEDFVKALWKGVLF